MFGKIYGITFLCFLLFLTGCKDIKPADASEGKYSTINALSASEYNMFMARQIGIMTNHLNARMIAIQSTDYSRSAEEKAATENSLVSMKMVVDSIKTTTPAKTYEKKRETVLLLAQASCEHMEQYRNALENGESIKEYKTIFFNDFNQLTGEATLFMQ